MNGIERIVGAELLPDEQLLWAGQPSLQKLFTKTDMYLVPFSIFFCAIPIMAIASMLEAGALFGLVIIIPFLAVGLYLMAGRFFVKAHTKKRTVYAVTSRRVLCLTLGSAGEKKKETADVIANIRNEYVTAGRDGSGNLYFGDVPYYARVYLNTGLEFLSMYRHHTVVFVDVDEAQRVYEIYRSAKYGVNK